jgi:hypothetical protein
MRLHGVKTHNNTQRRENLKTDNATDLSFAPATFHKV